MRNSDCFMPESEEILQHGLEVTLRRQTLPEA